MRPEPLPPESPALRKVMRSAAIVGICLGSLAVRAEIELHASAGRVRYDSVEKLDGGWIADRDRGWLSARGLAVDASIAGLGQLGLDLRQASGHVLYLGHSQFGLPAIANSRIEIDEACLALIRELASGSNWRIAGEARLGERRFDRRISPSLFTTPLNEVLNWKFAGVGSKLEWRAGSRWTLAAAAAVRAQVGSRLEVDFLGFNDKLSVVPRAGRPGLEGSVGVGYAATRAIDLRFGLSAERVRYGASAWVPYTRGGVPAGLLRYPGATQRFGQAWLTVDWRWP